ncbi:ABC transporter ATP-binding protein [Mariniflexile rhizosphaerae]|uniref:ABC transporter ATP-binding protein n=1 Tax=unclassified Mariniflexile TaxID=2643887 RepID=UPI000CA7FF13|nr:ABC transporter ATP-binding protein [Mariniflexile sp. TRM1-10]PLB19774.1 MAG: Multiple sugar-binding ABC transporter, ATP-binding protein [Flavobacteriaceae bacterium FS1-H7996/R]
MLQVNNLTFQYKKQPILKDINFSVKTGEHFAIIGESGSGKSTLLKLLYGTYDLNEGQIFWKDKEILGPKHNLIVGPEFMKYVAQEFDLMPFITVAENIGAFLSNFYPDEKQARIKELLEVVELQSYANTKAKELSGGQKQRVAIAKAIAKQPEVLLLDEPFSHIDNFKKQSLRRSLFKYLKEKHITCIVATHDKDDVLSFSDQMIVLHDAKIMAKGTPEQLYKNPQNKLIASFFDEFNDIENYGIVYANQLKLVENSNLKATVKHAYFKGSYYLIEADLNGKMVFFESDIDLDKKLNICLSVLK